MESWTCQQHGLQVLPQARAGLSRWGAVAATLWRALLQVVDITLHAAAQHRIGLRGVLDLHAHTCLWL